MLDSGAAAEARRFLKAFLIDSNDRILWAATGSAMATFWTNLAKVPTNGYCLLVHMHKVCESLNPIVPLT